MTSLGAETGLTVLDSRAEMRAEDRSWAETGVVTWELMLLSKHHLTEYIVECIGAAIQERNGWAAATKTKGQV